MSFVRDLSHCTTALVPLKRNANNTFFGQNTTVECSTYNIISLYTVCRAHEHSITFDGVLETVTSYQGTTVNLLEGGVIYMV